MYCICTYWYVFFKKEKRIPYILSKIFAILFYINGKESCNLLEIHALANPKNSPISLKHFKFFFIKMSFATSEDIPIIVSDFYLCVKAQIKEEIKYILILYIFNINLYKFNYIFRWMRSTLKSRIFLCLFKIIIDRK